MALVAESTAVQANLHLKSHLAYVSIVPPSEIESSCHPPSSNTLRHSAHKYGPQWSAPALLVLLTLCPVLLPLHPGTQIAWLEVMAMVWSTALFLHLYQTLNIQSKLGLYLFFSGMIALTPSMVKAQNVGNAPSSACNSGFLPDWPHA